VLLPPSGERYANLRFRRLNVLHVRLLGPPLVTFGESHVSLSGRPKVLPLLTYLVLHAGAPVERERLAAALWPDNTDTEARANLRRHLHALLQALPPAGEQPWILADAAHLAWNARAAYVFDVAEFERCAAEPARYDEAVALYRGDLLDDLDEEWLAEPRRELGVRYTACLLELIALHRARRQLVRAREYAGTLLAYDPWREDALRQLLVIAFEAGDRAGAVREYWRFHAALQAELGVEPMPETVAVFRAIERGVRPPGAALPAPAPSDGAVAPEPRLIGRAPELERLSTAWREAAAGTERTIAVTGAAGIGKSRLAREFALHAEAQGALVAYGAGVFPETTPYQPFAAIVRSLAGFAPALDIDPLWRAALLPLVPELGGAAQTLPDLPVLDPARARARFFEAFATLLEAVAAVRPVCAIVEDLHWAGPATLQLCAYLVRRLRHSPILWLLTWREDDAAAQLELRELRRELEAGKLVEMLPLRPLSRDDTQELVRSLAPLQDELDVGAARRLHEFCGGIPFYVVELTRDATSPNEFEPARSAALTQSLNARMLTLDERARTLLENAAVLGYDLDTDVLREFAGWYEGEVADALDELLDRRLVRERRSGAFAFAHQLVAAAVYETLEPAQRVRKHRRAAHVLEKIWPGRGELSGEIGAHYERAGEPERAAQAYVRAAAHALALFATQEARRYADRALELSATPRTRFDALEIAQRAAAIQGERSAQGEYAGALLETAGALGSDELCAALRARIDLANGQSDHVTEHALIDRLSAEAARSGSVRWQAAALEAQARVLRSTGEFDAARDCFAQMAALGTASVDRKLYAHAHLANIDALIYRGRLDEARGLLGELRAELDDRDHPTELARVLAAFSRAAAVGQDYAGMATYAREAYELSGRSGDVEGQVLALHILANSRVYTFEARQAQEDYEGAFAAYERLGHRVGLASINVDYGLFSIELGLLERGAEHTRRALEIAAQIDFGWVGCIGNVNLSYCERLRGDLAAAKRAAHAALEFADRLGADHLRAAALGVLGAAERECGELDAALAHFERGVALRRPGGPSPRLGDNLSGLCATLLDAGRVADARTVAQELIALYEANPALAPQPAEWLGTAARTLRASGDEPAARALQRQAIAALKARAAKLEDPEIRAAFSALPFNRALRTRC
jgi:DNA-binding SARP family transcriptional activator